MEVKRLKLEYLSKRWREVRFGLLTASKFAQAMRSGDGDQFSRWSSRAELVDYYRKRKDVEQTGIMLRGLIYEPAVMKALRLYYGGGPNTVKNADGTKPKWRVQWSHGLRVAPEFRIGATPDARAICEGTTIVTRDGKRIVAPRAAVQFKTCSTREFDRHYAGRNEGPGHFAHEYNTACDDARVQVAIEAMLMRPRVDVGLVVALEITGDAAPRLSICQVDRDPEFEEWACRFAREFWDEVEPGWQPESYSDVLYEGRMTSFHDMMRANPVCESVDMGVEREAVATVAPVDDLCANDTRPTVNHTSNVDTFGDGTWRVHEDGALFVCANCVTEEEAMRYAGIVGEDGDLARVVADALSRTKFDPRRHTKGPIIPRRLSERDEWEVVCDGEEWVGCEADMRRFARNLNIGEAMLEAVGLTSDSPPAPHLHAVPDAAEETTVEPPRTWPLPDDLEDGALVLCKECDSVPDRAGRMAVYGCAPLSGTALDEGRPAFLLFNDDETEYFDPGACPFLVEQQLVARDTVDPMRLDWCADPLQPGENNGLWVVYGRDSLCTYSGPRKDAVRRAMEMNGELDPGSTGATEGDEQTPPVRMPPKKVETRGRKSGSTARYNRHHWYRGVSKGEDYGFKRTELRAAVAAYSAAYAAVNGKNPRLNSLIAECFGQKMSEVEPTDEAAERLRQWCAARVDADGKLVDVVNTKAGAASDQENEEEATETEGGGA